MIRPRPGGPQKTTLLTILKIQANLTLIPTALPPREKTLDLLQPPQLPQPQPQPRRRDGRVGRRMTTLMTKNTPAPTAAKSSRRRTKRRRPSRVAAVVRARSLPRLLPRRRARSPSWSRNPQATRVPAMPPSLWLQLPRIPSLQNIPSSSSSSSNTITCILIVSSSRHPTCLRPM